MTSRSPNIKFVIRAIFVKKGDKKGKKKNTVLQKYFCRLQIGLVGWWVGVGSGASEEIGTH